MVYLGAKKTSSSKVITSTLSLDLKAKKIVNSGIAKTSSFDQNQKQNDEKKSENS